MTAPPFTPLTTYDWDAQYDQAVGLWWANGPGQTPDTQRLTRRHVVPAGAGAMVIAAQLGQLDRIDTRAVLAAIRASQVVDPAQPHFGNVRFNYEDQGVRDTNAGFFAGQSLAILALEYAKTFPADARAILFDIVRDLAACMNRDARQASSHYPNKHLGDIVVAHLLSQAIGDERGLAELDEILIGLAGDYLAGPPSHPGMPGWGWGEDLSDIYSKILLDELSIFLCLSRRVPPRVRESCVAMLHHLLALEDGFTPGPRVPAIRSYNVLDTPWNSPRRNYRDTIRPFSQEKPPPISHVPQVGPLLLSRGWHELASPRPGERAPTRRIDVPLFGGRRAQAIIDRDCRLGGVSRFPLMDSAEHQAWGLAWQSMPVTFAHEAGDWGFLQFFSQTGDQPVGHPSLASHHTDPARIFRAMTPRINPPIVPRTYTLQRGAGLIALRVMPAVSLDWLHFGDRLRLISPTAQLTSADVSPGHSRLQLDYADRRVGVALLDPWRRSTPTLTREGNLADWGVTIPAEKLHYRRGVVLLWALHLHGLPGEAPTITRSSNPRVPRVARSEDEAAFDLDWRWPDHHWRLTIDPLSDSPLIEQGDAG